MLAQISQSARRLPTENDAAHGLAREQRGGAKRVMMNLRHTASEASARLKSSGQRLCSRALVGSSTSNTSTEPVGGDLAASAPHVTRERRAAQRGVQLKRSPRYTQVDSGKLSRVDQPVGQAVWEQSAYIDELEPSAMGTGLEQEEADEYL